MSCDIAQHVVIVGAGHGGGAVAAFLRQYGFVGAITLIGAEPHAPYQRPPLSKGWLKGGIEVDDLLLKPLAFYGEQNVELRLGIAATGIDRATCKVSLADGTEVEYTTLILATGALARSLPVAGAYFDNVMSLRNVEDAERLRRSIGPARRLVIIGGGYIGLECAATARAAGCEVVVLERANRLLERVASAPVSEFLAQAHREQGVEIEVGVDVESIEGSTRARAVRLQDGRLFECDAVLVGVGAVASIALALEAGLTCDDGVVVDDDCRTSDRAIFALGDIARRRHALYGRSLRLESVPSTLEQARRVAATLTGRAPAAAEVPWFWSDQYDLKLQMAGLLPDVTDSIARGDPTQRKFAAYHLRGECVVAVESVNSPGDFMAGRKMIAAGRPIRRSALADPQMSLAAIMA